MKELTIERKAKRYDEVLEKAKALYGSSEPMSGCSVILETLFPELKESEDEKIRKGLIDFVNQYGDNFYGQISKASVIAWLEKQGKQKSTDKVEPKFKVGDWITDGQLTCKVLSVISKSYELHLYNDDYCHFETDVQSVDKHYHLWTIQDAKDGDVLCLYYNNRKTFFIFKAIIGEGDYADILVHCCYTGKYQYLEPSFNGECRMHQISDGGYCLPADKEERDILFQKMHEAGYMWDSDSKQLLSLKAEPSGEQKPAELAKGEDYGIDGLWHAQRILEKTFGKVYGYQTDDGILSHECAISAVKELYEKKPTDEEMKTLLRTEYEKGRADAITEMQKEWSEEDELQMQAIIDLLPGLTIRHNWLRSLKGRVQPKQEWNEEDEPQKELAEAYLAVFDKKFPILPTLKGKQLADYKNFLNKCQQIFGLKYWGIRPIQAKLFEKLSLLWAAWGAEHLQGLGQTDGDMDDEILWSEEDEENFRSVYLDVKSARQNTVNSLSGELKEREQKRMDEVISWLKSLKGRVQPKQEWSEEDKDFMYDTLSNLTELKDRYGELYGNVGKCIDWLRAFRPQNRWKPSDEQLNNILDVLSFDNCTPKRRELLQSLYEQLKKLKEG